MSVRALCLAARDILREKFPLEGTQCDVRINGRPPYFAGDRYVAIWGSQWVSGDPIQLGLSELIGFTCTVTFASGVAPDDRLPAELVYAVCEGAEQWARRIQAILVKHQYEVMCLANQYVEQEACGCVPEIPTYRIQSPATWLGSDPTPREMGPDWLSADPFETDDPESASQMFAIIMDVRFGDAARVTPNEGIVSG